MLEILVAYNKNWAIGSKGALPWHIPEELAHFKRETQDKTCVMGRKTWESIPEKFRPLSGRINVVISRSPTLTIKANGKGPVQLSSSLEEAFRFICEMLLMPPVLIGGAQLYKEAIEKKRVWRVIASEIKGHLDIEADAFFPNLQELGWKETLRRDHGSYERVIWYPPIEEE
jgi:dihydrofolate reductase